MKHMNIKHLEKSFPFKRWRKVDFHASLYVQKIKEKSTGIMIQFTSFLYFSLFTFQNFCIMNMWSEDRNERVRSLRMSGLYKASEV